MNFIIPAIYSLVAESEGYSPSTLVDVPIESGDNPGNNFVMFQTCNLLLTGSRCRALALDK
jgi:hypothetical protein